MQHIMYEEDIEVVHAALISLLGKDGRILPRQKDVVMDVTVYTPKTGVIWYGDIYRHEMEQINAVLTSFNVTAEFLS